MRRWLPAVLILIALSLFVSACSSSGSEETAEEVLTEDAEMEDEHMNDEDMDDEHMDDEHMEDEDMDDEHMDDGSQMEHMHAEPPTEFAGLTNPFTDDETSISAGKVIFETNCVTCHGTEGEGDGPGAVGLDPQPANLSDSMMMSDMSDGYLFWRVTKGGAMEPFNSAMIAWEQVLSEDQRWQVISYVRTLSGE